MQKFYNKLVRDKIPEIIQSQGNQPVGRVLESREEYRCALLAKLREEAEEFSQEPSLEEFCDVMEVLDALKNEFSFTEEQISVKRREKEESNGAFHQRWFLEEIIFGE